MEKAFAGGSASAPGPVTAELGRILLLAYPVVRAKVDSADYPAAWKKNGAVWIRRFEE